MKIYKGVDFQVYQEDNVKFYKKGHIYLNKDTNVRYTSVTTCIKTYEPETNWEYWSFYKALEGLCIEQNFGDLKPLNALKALVKSYKAKNYSEFEAQTKAMEYFMLKTKVFTRVTLEHAHRSMKETWAKNKKDGLERGSRWHQKEEEKALFINKILYGNQFVELSKEYKYKANHKFKLTRATPDGAYVEILISHPLIQIGGQADQVYIETKDGVRYIDIGDWKTNKKFTMENKFSKLTEPLNHLDNCDYYKYSLQLSFYAWMAECLGFIPRNLLVAHVNNNSIRPIPLEYLRNEIFAIAYDRLQELNAKTI